MAFLELRLRLRRLPHGMLVCGDGEQCLPKLTPVLRRFQALLRPTSAEPLLFPGFDRGRGSLRAERANPDSFAMFS